MMKKEKNLSSLQYAGLEYVFQKIVDTYESEYLGAESYGRTPVSQITRRTTDWLLVFDGAFDLSMMEDFAIKGLYAVDGSCILSGFKMDSDPEECFDRQPDLFVDITELVDEKEIDIDYLLSKLEQAELEF